MPLLANGHTKPGLLPPSLYTGHATLPRARLDQLATTCSRYELRQAGEMEVDCAKSYDQLLGGVGERAETDTQIMMESTSGSAVQPSEVSSRLSSTILTSSPLGGGCVGNRRAGPHLQPQRHDGQVLRLLVLCCVL